jgi:hypothetical protein
MGYPKRATDSLYRATRRKCDSPAFRAGWKSVAEHQHAGRGTLVAMTVAETKFTEVTSWDCTKSAVKCE